MNNQIIIVLINAINHKYLNLALNRWINKINSAVIKYKNDGINITIITILPNKSFQRCIKLLSAGISI